MGYLPKVITGEVKGTGWAIDGHVLYFSQWDWDNYESWLLYGWDDADDEEVMQTMYQTETEAGFCCSETLEAFAKAWKAKEWEPAGVFCLPLDQVAVLEVKQEEQKDEQRDKLKQYGIDLSPRKTTDKGGILCLPLDDNLNGDVQAKHPDWEPTACPHCGAKCWKSPEVIKLMAAGTQALCTKCAIGAGLVTDARNQRKPGGNRAQRRKKRHGEQKQ